MAKDPIKKATNGTYYFRANLGYNPVTGKQIQKYRSGFKTKKEAKEEYSKLFLASAVELEEKRIPLLLNSSLKKYIFLGTKHRLKKVPISTVVLLFKNTSNTSIKWQLMKSSLSTYRTGS